MTPARRAAGSSQVAQSRGSSTTGMRSWMGAIRSLALVVTMAQVAAAGAGGSGCAGWVGATLPTARRRPSAGRRAGGWRRAASGRAAVASGAALPLVEGVGRDEAAPAGQGGPVGGLLVDALGPGVDHPAADRRILRPRRHQPPAEGAEGPAGTFLPRSVPAPHGHRVHVQGGGHVVAGRQGLGADLVHLEHLGQLGQRRRGGVTPAHG